MPQRIAFLALLLAVLPTIAIHLNYLIAASEGSVPWCVPYWQSCTSISATGRSGLAFYFFKATMLPIAVLYWLYWRAAQHRLAGQGYGGNAIVTLGGIAVVALVAYVLALGAVGDSFQLTRRIGIIFFFTFTYLCQLLILWQLNRLAIADPGRNLQLGLLLLILAIGLITVILDMVMADYGAIEDAFEWVIALLLHGNFLLAAWGWRATSRTVLLPQGDGAGQ